MKWFLLTVILLSISCADKKIVTQQPKRSFDIWVLSISASDDDYFCAEPKREYCIRVSELKKLILSLRRANALEPSNEQIQARHALFR